MLNVDVWVVVVWDKDAGEPMVQVFADEETVAEARRLLIEREFAPEDIFIRRFRVMLIPEAVDVMRIDQTWTPEGV